MSASASATDRPRAPRPACQPTSPAPGARLSAGARALPARRKGEARPAYVIRLAASLPETTADVIAEAAGCSRQRVWQILQKDGWARVALWRRIEPPAPRPN